MKPIVAAILLSALPTGCVQHSPGAKVSTVITISLTPPATTLMPL